MLQVNDNDTQTIKVMKSEFLIAIENKFFHAIFDIHYIATFLDSRYKNMKFLSGEERDEKMRMIEDSIINFAKTNPVENLRSKSCDKAPKQASMKSLEDSSDDEELGDIDVRLEISTYRSIKEKRDNHLEFWELNNKKFPILSGYSRRILCAQASSALSERIFRHAGKINCAERASMKPQTTSAVTRCKSAKLNNFL